VRARLQDPLRASNRRKEAEERRTQRKQAAHRLSGGPPAAPQRSSTFRGTQVRQFMASCMRPSVLTFPLFLWDGPGCTTWPHIGPDRRYAEVHSGATIRSSFRQGTRRASSSIVCARKAQQFTLLLVSQLPEPAPDGPSCEDDDGYGIDSNRLILDLRTAQQGGRPVFFTPSAARFPRSVSLQYAAAAYVFAVEGMSLNCRNAIVGASCWPVVQPLYNVWSRWGGTSGHGRRTARP
jgi:hypothetical protein